MTFDDDMIRDRAMRLANAANTLVELCLNTPLSERMRYERIFGLLEDISVHGGIIDKHAILGVRDRDNWVEPVDLAYHDFKPEYE